MVIHGNNSKFEAVKKWINVHINFESVKLH